LFSLILTKQLIPWSGVLRKELIVAPKFKKFHSVYTVVFSFSNKAVPVLPLPEHHAMKAYGGVEVQLHPFFDLCTRWR
jgi:hypothetical protein